MKKLLTVLIFLTIIFAGINFGSKAISSVQKEAEVLPASIVDESSESMDSKKIDVPVVALPQTLKIPKINVDTIVEAAGIDEQRKPILPQNSDNVVWYNLGPKPGEKGSSVISGHWDKETGAPAVFYDLNKLDIGDEIIVIDSENQKHKFIVTKKVNYPFDEVPLQEVYASSSDTPLLNLITCGGTWNAASKLYSHRTVIYSEMSD